MNKNDIIKKYSGAKEIHAVMRNKKMRKKEIIFDWIIALVTPLPGIVEDVDFVSDMGTYYLIINDNTNKLVRVTGNDVTEQEISVNCKKRTFVVNGNWFTKVGKIYG
ncbi:MAG: hypothetical protein UH239_07990 [Acutalibacteraceae bacterium]|nr:hypothetical protein [Acutalibacteraceae bacterium]